MALMLICTEYRISTAPPGIWRMDHRLGFLAIEGKEILLLRFLSAFQKAFKRVKCRKLVKTDKGNGSGSQKIGGVDRTPSEL